MSAGPCACEGARLGSSVSFRTIYIARQLHLHLIVFAFRKIRPILSKPTAGMVGPDRRPLRLVISPLPCR
eukprot:141035-Chlamydomonas_euryale.AAC.9